MVATDHIQKLWADLNVRYFHGALAPIPIVWSRRLTASTGLFVSRGGPRAVDVTQPANESSRRCIKLSLPLLDSGTPAVTWKLTRTLAHEMIHQWQYDVLKRRPNHGADFRRMMDRMNQDGLSITIYHSLARETEALSRYAWRCQQCGHIYRRQRRTSSPVVTSAALAGGRCGNYPRQPSFVTRHSSEADKDWIETRGPN